MAVIERLVAFDPGSVATGWCFFLSGEYREGGVFLGVGDDFGERRHSIRQQVCETLLRLNTEEGDIDIVAVEEPMGRSMDTKGKLVTIAADIESAASSLGIPYLEGRVRPHEWHAEVKRAAQLQADVGIKALGLAIARAHTGRELMSQDESDAYWICKFMLHNARRGDG